MMFQDWDIKTKIEMSKCEQAAMQEQERKTILRSCSYIEIISTPYLKSAMGW